MATSRDFTLVPAGTVANAVNQVLGTLSGLESYNDLRAQIKSSAVGGTTPSVTVVLEDTVNGSDWNVIDTFTAITTATARETRSIAGFRGSQLRARVSALTGTTPTVTLGIQLVAE